MVLDHNTSPETDAVETGQTSKYGDWTSWVKGAVIGAGLFLTGCTGYDRDAYTNGLELEDRIEARDEQPTETAERYGIIIGASTDDDMTMNISDAYDAMIQNDYDPEDIFILDTEDTERRRLYPVADSSSADNLETVIDALEDEVDQDDTVFLYTTGHGTMATRDGEQQTYLPVHGTDITDDELADQLARLDAGQVITLHDQCYSKGFADEITERMDAVSIAASGYEVGTSIGGANLFGGWVLKGLQQEKSIEDAYQYAVENDGGENPALQHSDSIDPDSIYLGVHE